MNHKNKKSSARLSRSLIILAILGAFPIGAAFAAPAPVPTDAPVSVDAAPPPADPAAQADTAPAPAAGGQKLETVIVTANRRSENIKDVPMSISTLKGDRLDALTAGGEDVRFLANRVPSLNVESDFGRTFPRFYIRGLGNTDFDLNASQPVGIIYDDVVQENAMLKGFPVFDTDQIEVLRGPQGTLFGRNAPAGVVKFSSTRPTDKYEGYATIGYGKDNTVNFEGAYNMPMSPELFARVSLLSQSRDDRVHNPLPTGTQNLEGYGDHAARVQLLYKPSTTFNALFNIHHRDLDGSATLFRANIIKPGTNTLVDGFNYRDYPTDGHNKQYLHETGGSIKLRWDLDGVTLHSITGYESVDLYSRADVDGGYGAVYALPMGPGTIPFESETADALPDHHQFTQEFRVESNYASPLQWIAGVYSFNEHITVDSYNYDTLNNGVQNGFARQQQVSKSWAGFGSVNYAFSDRFKVRAGVRYTDDKKDFTASRYVDPNGSHTIGPLTAHPRSTNVSWDLSADYAFNSDTNLYARAATGYRAPSIQGRILFGDTISVAGAERNLSFEAGVKEDLLDKTARLSASLFHYRVKDLQLTAGSGAVNQNQLVNAEKAIGEGAEVEFQMLLAQDWRMTLGGSYNYTQIQDPNLFVAPCGNGCSVTNPAGSVPGTVLINGNPLPRAPRWVGNATLRWGTPFADGEVYAYTDWSYRDSYNMFLYEAKEYKARSLVEGGARAGYKWHDGKYELAAYVRNITDKVQVVAAIDFNNLAGILNEPRTYGVQFKANF